MHLAAPVQIAASSLSRLTADSLRLTKSEYLNNYLVLFDLPSSDF